MAEILKIVVDEIRTSIKQTFDDKEISRTQVAYWVILVGNTLLGQHIAKRDSGAQLVTYVVDIIELNGRKYIEIPVEIFDFDRDGGVEFMAYFNPLPNCRPEFRRKLIQRTTAGELQWLELVKQTKPSPENPYFWRAGEKLYLEGIEGVPVKQIEFGVYQMISPLSKIDLNAPFVFPGELLNTLKRMVTDLARFSFMFKTDESNDGVDSSADAQKQIPKIISVNDQQQG